MSLGLSTMKQKSLKDAELKEQLQEMRQADNLTNGYYLLRTYLFLALVLGGAVGFIVIALFMPLVSLITSLTGGK